MTNDERQRLQAVLRAYGADPAKWPDADRHLAVDAGSQDSAEALEIDSLLSAASSPQIPEAMVARIAALAGPSSVVAFPARPKRSVAFWPAAAMMAASLALGVYLGAADPGSLFSFSDQTAELYGEFDPIGLDQADDDASGDQV